MPPSRIKSPWFNCWRRINAPSFSVVRPSTRSDQLYRMPSNNTHAIARIVYRSQVAKQGRHVGTAIIVGPRHVMTCCHVINDEIGRDRLEPPPPPADQVFDIRFPYASNATGTGKIAKWGLGLAHARDVAVIELSDPLPAGAQAAVFSESEVQGGKWLSNGWNVNGDEQQAEGVCGPILAPVNGTSGVGDRQLNGPDAPIAARIVAGFSGGAVWSDAFGAIVGMVVTKDVEQMENGLAFAIPTLGLLEVWPDLLQLRNGVFDPAAPQADDKAHIIDDDIVVLDREDVSSFLKRLQLQAAHKCVILIRGGPRSGKTHCKYLFELAAEGAKARPVYIDRDLGPTVDDVIASLFSSLRASDKKPPADSTAAAWYKTVLNRLYEAAPAGPLWVAVDDLGFDKDGAPFVDPEVRNFFDQFVLHMKSPTFRDHFRLMLIDYSDARSPISRDKLALFAALLEAESDNGVLHQMRQYTRQNFDSETALPDWILSELRLTDVCHPVQYILSPDPLKLLADRVIGTDVLAYIVGEKQRPP